MDAGHEKTIESEGRPKREAAKITDFKSFHRTGDTGAHQKGKVAAAVEKLETPDKSETRPETQTTPRGHIVRALDNSHGNMSELERLKEELRLQREQNQKAQLELEEAKVRAQIEQERAKEKEIEIAKKEVECNKLDALRAHEAQLRALAESKAESTENAAMKFLQEKLAEMTAAKTNPEMEEKIRKQQEVTEQLKKLMQQQQELVQAATQAAEGCEATPEIQKMLQALSKTAKNTPPQDEKEEQEAVMKHLMATLQGQKTDSKIEQQKDILKQFLVDANKVSTTGGATTLKPDLLKKLTGESDYFNMTEWLANLNKRKNEEGKCEACAEECKQHKKSGMLDKATANIRHKEIWPQKNLLEDWADEEIEFKHILFEHMVAGELRTIEISTEPAQILGRIRLLRKMAYAKLRGYEWPIIRKMYAAIVRSIESGENTWETNFDRYETILYRRPPTRREDRSNPSQNTQQNNQSNKKWFCRDWNKGNCTKTAPHKAWFGTGTNAVSRTVLHMCATCYMKDKTQKDHPESHESCPHKEA